MSKYKWGFNIIILNTSTGYRNTSTGYRHTSTGYRHTSTGYRHTSTGYRHTNTGYRNTSTGYRNTSTGYRHTSTGYRQTTSLMLSKNANYTLETSTLVCGSCFIQITFSNLVWGIGNNVSFQKTKQPENSHIT